ncbi:unnamed protein product [Miscanthus lutarioriparius]|uniref:Uncharacterized protein n=1 Tax=Miscanthus lutarioriparius TaxID=422564 RepID=A0A811MP38_9POAL|nr:unnamed protein product [Miscanthus lutarioriparius]
MEMQELNCEVAVAWDVGGGRASFCPLSYSPLSVCHAFSQSSSWACLFPGPSQPVCGRVTFFETFHRAPGWRPWKSTLIPQSPAFPGSPAEDAGPRLKSTLTPAALPLHQQHRHLPPATVRPQLQHSNGGQRTQRRPNRADASDVAVELDEARPRVKPGVADGDGEERRRVARDGEICRRGGWHVEQAAAVAAMAASARGAPHGLSSLQRVGTGLVLSVSAMVVVTLMEKNSH